MQPELFEIPSSGRRRQAESHDGERFLFVLEGDVKLTYGDEVVSLSPGDSIYFDASIPHLVAAAGRSTAKVLSVSHDGSRIQAGNGTAKPRRKGAGAIAGARA